MADDLTQLEFANESQPVTVIIKRQCKAGQEANYENWLKRFQVEARSLKGYRGVTTQRPSSKSGQPYLRVIRFTGLDALGDFEASEMRARYLEEVLPYVQGDAIWERMSGLEFWFSPPAGTLVPQPSRFRMAMVMIAVVFLLVLSIGSPIGVLLPG
jgi:antibiotic biosynthesis monooxygenase (ABM) superfamily enzyme